MSINDLERGKFNANGDLESSLVDSAGVPYGKAKANGWQGVSLVRSSDGTELGNTTDVSDGVSAQLTLVVRADNHLSNGTTWDRQRGNIDGTLLASAARTATTSSPVQTNHNARGVVVFLDVTTIGTGNITLNVSGVDPISGKQTGLGLAAAAVTATGIYGYAIYPGITTGFNARASAILPRSFVASVTHSDGSSWTYSLGYSLIV